MRTGKFLPLVVGVSLLSLCTVAIRPGHAGQVATDINFSATNQSMWGPGSAFILDTTQNPQFFGTTWDTSGSFGPGVTGSPPFAFGFNATASTSGKVGVDVGYKVDGGSVNVNSPITAAVMFPDVKTYDIGQQIALNGMYQMNNATINSTFPELQAFVDLDFAAKAGIQGRVCAFACASGGSNSNIINIPEVKHELVSFNRDDNGSVSVLGFSVPIPFGTRIPLPPSGPNPGIVGVTANVPDIHTAGTFDGKVTPGTDPLSSMGIDPNILRLDFSITQVAAAVVFAATGVNIGPLLQGSLDIIPGKLGIKYTTLDAQFGAEFGVKQQFTFQPDVQVQYDFDHPVNVVGQGLVSSLMLPIDDPLNLIAPDETVNVSTKYWFDPFLHNQTFLSITPDFFLKVLQASLTVLGLPTPLSIGPLFSKTFPLSNPFLIPIFDSTFALGDSVHVDGDPFMIMAKGVLAPIPEPETLILLGSGLILLGYVYRRKTQNSLLVAQA